MPDKIKFEKKLEARDNLQNFELYYIQNKYKNTLSRNINRYEKGAKNENKKQPKTEKEKSKKLYKGKGTKINLNDTYILDGRNFECYEEFVQFIYELFKGC